MVITNPTCFFIVNRDRLNSYAAPIRILLFLITLLLLWLPIAAPMYLIWGEAVGVGLTILLYCGFLGLIWGWGHKIAKYSHPYRYYGLLFTKENGRDFLLGLGLGCVTLIIFFSLQVSLGWLVSQSVDWRNPLPARLLPAIGLYFVDWQGAIAPGLLTSVGVGFAEEMLFRGWILSELERDYSPKAALLGCSFVFAILHFIKPLNVILATWSQFLGLVMLSIALVLARRRCNGRLGISIGLHAGLVWCYYIVNTTHWLAPTGIVPEWVTGINGNPIAGIMGIAFLSAISLGFAKFPQKISL
ncbi:CPBP family intramembrane glutamic endopeptidase [Pseudanabaena sp. 'Roaring Creek']|uniref:CPBP family intramembrane glutamic endopeptidase n=1 Tax=Pseudanabaena sp. 'Roaring Creek' TaxID=1681830 RepID=UPI000A61A4CC|nr:CPBP family intramembrane glutamic endopeptidase [Pseudanabaena sp. 'Roaring Creek']